MQQIDKRVDSAFILLALRIDCFESLYSFDDPHLLFCHGKITHDSKNYLNMCLLLANNTSKWKQLAYWWCGCYFFLLIMHNGQHIVNRVYLHARVRACARVCVCIIPFIVRFYIPFQCLLSSDRAATVAVFFFLFFVTLANAG